MFLPSTSTTGGSDEGVRPRPPFSLKTSSLYTRNTLQVSNNFFFKPLYKAMSAQVQYEQARALPLDAGGRRIPFANTGNQMPVARSTGATTPTKPNQVPKKAAGSPPLPRQNTKTAPPSPPQVIRDTTHAVSYSRVGFLGEVCFFEEKKFACVHNV